MFFSFRRQPTLDSRLAVYASPYHVASLRNIALQCAECSKITAAAHLEFTSFARRAELYALLTDSSPAARRIARCYGDLFAEARVS